MLQSTGRRVGMIGGGDPNGLIPNPDDPFGMADLGFARVPRGLADTTSASIKRMSYHAARIVAKNRPTSSFSHSA